jgi:branched-chain amino acid:cation transporter, LIVCS family
VIGFFQTGLMIRPHLLKGVRPFFLKGRDMKQNWLIISTGFALFSMFFGSGNLVFPLVVGLESGGHTWLATLGILLTGVLVPFLGVFGMMLYEGDINAYFRWFGKKGVVLFSFLALGLMGPFGVLARCLTVSHGALELLVPSLPLPLASFLLCVLIFFLTANKSRIVGLLGTVLTPFLLLSIVVITFFAFYKGVSPDVNTAPAWTSFKTGFFQGYQTMDLLAAFFFSQFVIKHLYSKNVSRNTLKIFGLASVIGGGILATVYFLLVLLGWIYSPTLTGQPPQEMLGLVALQSLGSLAAPLVCLAVVFACLTTSIILASLFSDFLQNEIAGKRIGSKTALLITLIIGFLVSTLEFSGIARFICPILETIYPVLILITVINIGLKLVKQKAIN